LGKTHGAALGAGFQPSTWRMIVNIAYMKDADFMLTPLLARRWHNTDAVAMNCIRDAEDAWHTKTRTRLCQSALSWAIAAASLGEVIATFLHRRLRNAGKEDYVAS
jgi:hypothetical protein